MARVLVVDDSRTQLLQIRAILEQAHFDVETCSSGTEALAVLGRDAPDIVVTDMIMPGMDGLELVERVRREFAWVPVVLVTSKGSEELAAQALRQGAASYVPIRDLKQVIVSTLRNVLKVAKAKHDHRRVVQSFLTDTESHLTIDNDLTCIPPLVSYMEEEMVRLAFGDETTLLRVRVALNEALVNAIEHGNLELDSQLRLRDDNSYSELAARRRSQAPYQDRRVNVTYKVSPFEATFRIHDEGPGFDTSAVPDPTDPANIHRPGGRGLLLIKTFMDRVEFNDRGNQITMVKRRDAAR